MRRTALRVPVECRVEADGHVAEFARHECAVGAVVEVDRVVRGRGTGDRLLVHLQRSAAEILEAHPLRCRRALVGLALFESQLARKLRQLRPHAQAGQRRGGRRVLTAVQNRQLRQATVEIDARIKHHQIRAALRRQPAAPVVRPYRCRPLSRTRRRCLR